ncbi:MAG TPA: hypothetical protein VMY77_18240 [Chitinophagaceae bacterium]|nr:hypothetical protein [Chitinophagaceae bacterium]
MKKYLFLTFILSALYSTTILAQAATSQVASAKGATDQVAMLQKMKETMKPKMIEKTGLSDAKADKVLEINLEMRMAAAALKDLNEADRSAKIAELKAAKEKKLSELLTADEFKALNAYYADMAKNAPPKPAN